jgi:hypothetical protein
MRAILSCPALRANRDRRVAADSGCHRVQADGPCDTTPAHWSSLPAQLP